MAVKATGSRPGDNGVRPRLAPQSQGRGGVPARIGGGGGDSVPPPAVTTKVTVAPAPHSDQHGDNKRLG